MIGGILFSVIEAKLGRPSNKKLTQLFFRSCILVEPSLEPSKCSTRIERYTAAAKVNEQSSS